MKKRLAYANIEDGLGAASQIFVANITERGIMSSEQIIETLKDRGMRITKQRALVARVIAENDGASCKDICCIVRAKDRTVGTATVYRMIKALEDIGIVERIDMIKLQC